MMAVKNQMNSSRVLRFAREDAGFVLVHVSHRGPERLDLDLKGTENENPYFISIYHNKLSEFKSRTKNFDDTAWSSAVAWALLRATPTPEYRDIVDQLEVLANIESGKGLVLKFRQNLEKGLKPFVGSIVLAHDESQELDLFEWAGLSTESAQSSLEQIDSLSGTRKELNSAVESLKKQLEDLQRTKKEEENELLEKFRQLLNMKKLKIRDQQRLLASAKVNSESATMIKRARESENSCKHPKMRLAKRKADGGGEDIENDEPGSRSGTESEDEFETLASPDRSDSEDESVTLDGRNSPKMEQSSARDIPLARNATTNLADNIAIDDPKDVQMENANDDETDDEL